MLTEEEENWVKEQVKENDKWKQARALDSNLSDEERAVELEKIYGKPISL